MCLVGIKNWLIHGLPEFSSAPPLEGGLDGSFRWPWNLIRSPPSRTPCRLFIHEVFFGSLGLHLGVWSELGRSPPFWPMRALRLQWSWAFEPSAVTTKLWEPKRNCRKAVPIHLQNYVVGSWILKFSVKSYATRPSTNCYFSEFLFKQFFTHDKWKYINSCERLACHGLPGFVLGLPPRGGFKKWSKSPWNMIHSMPWRIHVYFLHPTCIHRLILVPKHRGSQLGPRAAFSTNESAWSAVVTSSQSPVRSGP